MVKAPIAHIKVDKLSRWNICKVFPNSFIIQGGWIIYFGESFSVSMDVISDQICRFRLYTAMLPVNVFQTNTFYWLTIMYIHIITKLRIPCIRSTGSTLITLVRIGYVVRSSTQGRKAPIIIRGKIAKRGRIDIL